MAQGRSQIAFGNIARLTKMRVQVDKSGTKAQVILPGFSYDDFDRTGSISVHKLQKLLTAARFLAYHTPQEGGYGFLDYDHMTADRFTFMASTRTEICRSFYQLPKTSQSPPNLAINLNLGYIGGASLNSVACLTNLDNGDEYVKNINTVVSVDKVTRKPKPLPDWWVERYKDAVKENQRLVIRPVEVSHNTHQYNMKVMWNDIDGYKHTNYVAYVRYCLDAAMDATVNGHYSKFSEDILKYHIKKMEMLYKGESVANEELHIRTWENEDNPFKLHFDIAKNSTTIFQNTIEYYEPEG